MNVITALENGRGRRWESPLLPCTLNFVNSFHVLMYQAAQIRHRGATLAFHFALNQHHDLRTDRSCCNCCSRISDAERRKINGASHFQSLRNTSANKLHGEFLRRGFQHVLQLLYRSRSGPNEALAAQTSFNTSLRSSSFALNLLAVQPAHFLAPLPRCYANGRKDRSNGPDRLNPCRRVFFREQPADKMPPREKRQKHRHNTADANSTGDPLTPSHFFVLLHSASSFRGAYHQPEHAA